MRILHIDFEGGSADDLIGNGLHHYFEHWSTHVYCMGYRFDKEPVQVWYMWQTFPQDVIDHVAAGGVVVAHNAAFERHAWNTVLRRPNLIDKLPALDLPELKIEQQICTLARASTLALPAGLDFVAQVIELDNRKDDIGKKLMLKYAAPYEIIQHLDGTFTYKFYRDREEMLRIGEYCKQDVVVETDLDLLLPNHDDRERMVWELDQRINDRGVRLDLELAQRATEVVEIAKTRLHSRMNEITGEAVANGNQVGPLAKWISSRGIPCVSVAKGVQAELMIEAGIIDQTVVEAITIRQQVGKGSPTSKYKTMLLCSGADQKARGQLFYHGASTGRWAGRLIQFQNLPGVDEDRDLSNVLACVDLIKSDQTPAEICDALEIVVGKPLPVLSKCLRYTLISSEGCRFLGGDLSNIEGCVAAWVTDEEWKVKAYSEYQAGRGPDLYKVAYSKAFDKKIEEILKFQRQIGKVMELALGYQGSVGAFMNMAAIYGLKPADMVEPVRAATSPEDWEAAKAKMKYAAGRTFGLTVDEWTALRVVVDLWRTSHPAVVSSWWALQNAAIEAVNEPGKVVEVLGGRCAYLCDRGFLWCLLPSGRSLAYLNPYLKHTCEIEMQDPEGKTAWVQESDVDDKLKVGWVKTDKDERHRKSVCYRGFSSTTNKFGWHQLYGGLQFENIVQAIARDVMVEGMFLAEAKGYPIVLTVHDELLCDVPLGFGSADELKSLMSKVPHWAEGLPLKAVTWEDTRYAK